MKKLETSNAIEHLTKIAQKLKLEIRAEDTGIKDSELGIEKHMWLEDTNGKTKGSYFYWITNGVINQKEGISYIDDSDDYSSKSIIDANELYKKYKVRMPIGKKKVNNEIDKWEQIHIRYIQLCTSLYHNTDWVADSSFIQNEMDSPGFTERFINFSENGLEEYWKRIERELLQLDVWDEYNLQEALFRVMDDYQHENIGEFKDMSEIAFTLSFYFTPLLKVWFRWSPDKVDEFWDLLGEH